MRKRYTKLCAVFVAVITIFSAVFTTANANPDNVLSGYTVVYGDANLDGKVSLLDLSLLMRYCNGLAKLQAIQLINSDVNCDNKVNTADVSIILRYITGLITELPVVSEQHRMVALKNYTLPKSGTRLPLNKPYSLNAEITSGVPITSVTIKITDVNTSVTEIDESVYFPIGVYSYDVNGASHSLNKRVKFSSLSAGKKRLELTCATKLDPKITVYTSYFTMGFSFIELYGNVYDETDKISAATTNKILNLLNSYDTVSDTGKMIVGFAVNYLGKSYSEYDCSGFVRATYLNAVGITLPRISADQAKYCADNDMLIDFSELQPGDLVFMRRTDCGCDRYHDIHHSAIYLGEVDGVMYLIESTSSLYKVVIRDIWGANGGKWQIDCCARPYN